MNRAGRGQINLPFSEFLAQPQRVKSWQGRAVTFVVCIGVIVGVLVGEVVTPEQVTFGGFSLLAVLAATWLLPLSLSLPVTAAALAMPFVAVQYDAVDPLTAKFQFSATVVAAVMANLMVRAIRSTTEARQHTHEQLLHFTADAAHELRSPLTLMRATLEHMVRRPRSPEDYRQRAETVLEEVDRLIRVTNGLLTLAQSDAGSLALSTERCDALQLLSAARSRWRQPADTAGVRLEADAGTGNEVVCDPAMVGRVLDNLLENAIRHTPRGGTVSMGVQAAGDTCDITVSDTGCGIPPAIRESLFQRFRTATSGERRTSSGTGLGLAVSAAVAAAHGGAIELLRTDARGTAIVLHLPVTPASV
ncbi:MAG: HAMP domain-containing histidine kinase [Candidatus Dormibacteraeota bacterium]|nr:HAMP domain-containing histidine kinase [Candidatus Dormibacteraeota bacterium]